MSSVTNLTTALGLPNFVSTVSGSISQDLPGLMFLSTGSVTNRAQIENIQTSVFPFAVQPGFSLANLFDGSLPVGGIFTNPVSVAQQPFIPGLLSVTNQAGLPNSGVLPNFPIFQQGAFTQGGNPNLQFPTNGNILLGGLLSNGVPQAGGQNPGTPGNTGLNAGGALGGGLQQGGSLFPSGAIQSTGGVLTPGNNGQVTGAQTGGLGAGALTNQQLAALLMQQPNFSGGQLSVPQLSNGMFFQQPNFGTSAGLGGGLSNQQLAMLFFGNGMGQQTQMGLGGGLSNQQLAMLFSGNGMGQQLQTGFNSGMGQMSFGQQGFGMQNNALALAPSPFPFQGPSINQMSQQQAFSQFPTQGFSQVP